MALSFDFGRNWQAFSAERMDARRVEDAKASLRSLIGDAALTGRSFLDIGCGSGLFSIAAAACGARSVVGFDVNATAISTSEGNAAHFLPAGITRPYFRVGSVLDAPFLRGLAPCDTVYAWGSLHHTGSMWQAVRNTVSLVNPGGTLVLAIYNAHWTAPAWKQVKRLYNVSPTPVRRVMDVGLGALMYTAVWAVARENPMSKERGMDFRYDVIDWLGGYPYEVASTQQLVDFMKPLGFELACSTAPRVPTGCNELVFRHTAETS